jgi:lysyl-tRNA synthetase class 2
VDAALLVRRAAVVRSIRAHFDALGYTEVETPVRIAAPAPEPHIDCPPVATGGFLRASPELQMKKLLSAGMDRIYQIGPCFRDGERGSRHNPEFTMLEWYSKSEGYLEMADGLEALFRELAAAHAPHLAKRVASPFRRISVRDAYLKFAGWDPWTAWDGDRFDFDMATKIEPAVAKEGGGVFLVGYPREAASLAKLSGDVAERWELYWDGMELANCFDELCDGAEQARRFAVAREARREAGEADYPIDDEFLSSLDAIGAASGAALGVDRLVMCLLAAPGISSVRVL